MHPWSVVLVVPRANQFVAIARGFAPRNVNFPGGNRDPEDRTPADTAVRELYEETGLRTTPEFLRIIAKWKGSQGQDVYAFKVARYIGRLRSSTEGKVFWTSQLGSFISPTSEFAKDNAFILSKLIPKPSVRASGAKR